MARTRKWGNFNLNEEVDDAFSKAQSEIESLEQEMEEWRDNMEQSEGLSATEKFERISEATDILEQANGTLLDVQLISDGDTVDFVEQRKRGYPRSVRLGNALARLEAVVKYLEEVREQAQAAIDEIETVIGELENVEFPGMFG